MRVGIITIHRALNVGAALQVYSLVRAVKSLGHECEIIDYWPPQGTQSHMKGILNVRRINSRVQEKVFAAQHRMAKKRFNDFHSMLPIASPRLQTADEINAANLDYDVFICGSDQVWNPRQFAWEVTGPYYLSFVGEGNAKRVSYAASFGAEEIRLSDEKQKWIAEQIGRFDYISVRERSGVRIVNEITGRKAEHVLDPTLLVHGECFEEISEAPDVEDGYLFVYATQYPRTQEHTRIIKDVAREMGLRTLVYGGSSVHPKWFLQGGRLLFDVGPKQFLGLIDRASFVITTSFHGTALSIAYKKNFLTIPHSHYNSRMESLLSLLGLGSRLLQSGPSMGNVSSCIEPVDYSRVEPLLIRERRKSMDYLRASIEQ